MTYKSLIYFIENNLPIFVQRKIWIRNNGKNSRFWREVLLQDEIERNYKIFLSESQRADVHLMHDLSKDVIDSYILHGVIPNEYFMFGFLNNHDKAYRNSCLSVKEKDLVCMSQPYSKEALKQMTDKGLFYSLTSKYFKREVVVLRSIEDNHRFMNFFSRHKTFIVKPLNGQCGIGNFVYRGNENVDKIFNSLHLIILTLFFVLGE